MQLRGFQDAFNARLQAAAITDEIAWPNVVYTPTKGVSYLKPENAGRSRSPLGFGADGVQLWNGIYQIGVYVSRDVGEDEQEELASKVLDAFPRGLNLPTPDGQINIIVSHSTAAVPVPFGDWSNLPVSVTWFATETPP